MTDSSGESEPDRQIDSDDDNEVCEFAYDDVEYIPGLEIFYDTSFFPSVKTFTSSCRIQESVQLKGDDPIHYFEYFIDDALLDLICKETNRYQTQNPEPEHIKMSQWVDLEKKELLKFLALSILMGHVKKGCLKDYWSTSPALLTPIFGQTMSRNRYCQILRFLHFRDNEILSDHPLRKVKNVIDNLKAKFSNALCPGQKVCIDESLMLWKGRLSFKQYLPLKSHRFGIKIFMLVDCETGMILDFIVYTGADTDYEHFDLGVSGDIVATMMKPYFGKGHILYTDNWYSSPILAEFLHEKDVGLCGTVRKNRKGFPSLDAKLEKGQIQSAHNLIWLAMKWQDKKEVYMITSVHEPILEKTGKKDHKTGADKIKPQCIIDYNKNMGGIDLIDSLLSSTETVRKSFKWYRKLFFRIIDMAIINAHALYSLNGSQMTFPSFRLAIVNEILELKEQSRPANVTCPTRLIGKHLPEAIENKKRCTLCQMNKKRAESRIKCSKCSVTLCTTPCFAIYHTKPDLP